MPSNKGGVGFTPENAALLEADYPKPPEQRALKPLQLIVKHCMRCGKLPKHVTATADMTMIICECAPEGTCYCAPGLVILSIQDALAGGNEELAIKLRES